MWRGDWNPGGQASTANPQPPDCLTVILSTRSTGPVLVMRPSVGPRAEPPVIVSPTSPTEMARRWRSVRPVSRGRSGHTLAVGDGGAADGCRLSAWPSRWPPGSPTPPAIPSGRPRPAWSGARLLTGTGLRRHPGSGAIWAGQSEQPVSPGAVSSRHLSSPTRWRPRISRFPALDDSIGSWMPSGGGREERPNRSPRYPCSDYLPVLTYWMQSPWLRKLLPSACRTVIHPSFLHSSFEVATRYGSKS